MVEQNILAGFKQTEVGMIPDDWEIKSIKDITKNIIDYRGVTPKKLGMGWGNGSILALSAGNVKKGFIDFNSECYFGSEELYTRWMRNGDPQKDDIVFTLEAPLGNIALIPDNKKYILSQRTILLQIERSQYFPLYVFQYLISPRFQRYFSATATGSTAQGIKRTTFETLAIGIPPTLTEQTAIATALSDTDALISSLEKLIAKKKAIKQGAMQELLRPKEGWEVKNLGECAVLKARIGWQGLTTTEYIKTGEYFLITGTDFINGFIDWQNCVFVEKVRYDQDKNIQIRVNDVLVTKDGTIGKVAFIKSVPKPATLNSGIFVIRPITHAFHPEFFYYILHSEYFEKFLSQLSAGSTINHLYQKDFVSFDFATPKSIIEQKTIALILSDMDSEIEALEKKLEKYRQIKQGMMQMLLTGKIRLVKPQS